MRRLLKVLDNFSEDQGLDLGAYKLHIERHFNVVLHEEDVAGIQTLGELRDYIAGQREAQNQALPVDRIWAGVQRITAYEFGVDERELHEQIRYVEDLNC